MAYENRPSTTQNLITVYSNSNSVVQISHAQLDNLTMQYIFGTLQPLRKMNAAFINFTKKI